MEQKEYDAQMLELTIVFFHPRRPRLVTWGQTPKSTFKILESCSILSLFPFEYRLHLRAT